MKTAFAWIGAIWVWLSVLAMLDVIDFHSCIGAAGSCPTYTKGKAHD